MSEERVLCKLLVFWGGLLRILWPYCLITRLWPSAECACIEKLIEGCLTRVDSIGKTLYATKDEMLG